MANTETPSSKTWEERQKGMDRVVAVLRASEKDPEARRKAEALARRLRTISPFRRFNI